MLLKTLMLMLVLYLCGDNHQWQQRVGCDCAGLSFQLKPPLSDQIPALFQQLARIIVVISAGAQLITNTNTFTQWLHAAYCRTLWNIQQSFFFFLTCSHSRSWRDKTASKWKMRRLVVLLPIPLRCCHGVCLCLWCGGHPVRIDRIQARVATNN